MCLREELRSAVEMQLPATVQLAAMYVAVQEGLLDSRRVSGPPIRNTQYPGQIQNKVLCLESFGRPNNSKSTDAQMVSAMDVGRNMYLDIIANNQVHLQLN